jgi:hypothetical protein
MGPKYTHRRPIACAARANRTIVHVVWISRRAAGTSESRVVIGKIILPGRLAVGASSSGTSRAGIFHHLFRQGRIDFDFIDEAAPIVNGPAGNVM